MSRKQYFGIKYPFTNESFEKYELDLNSDETDRVTSDLLHLIFTPKRTRLRLPEFGTDLIKFIFEDGDDTEWEGIKNEIKTTVSDWITGVSLDDIQVTATEDGRSIYVRVDYSVTEGNETESKSVVVSLV